MRTLFMVPSRYLLLLLLLPLGACYKIIDWKDVWDKNKPDCRIEKIVTYSDFEPTRTGVFSYNQKGDPVSLIFDVTSTGLANFEFRYDQKHRLKDYVVYYPPNGYEFWYSYTYNSKNQVSADTFYYGGLIENGIPQPTPYHKYYANYEYDAYGRVVKIVRYRLPYSSWTGEFGEAEYFTTETYAYNSDGNLAVYRQENAYGIVSEWSFGPYDNKVNLHQTSKVLMFVDRNYSRNNPFSAAQYNSKGLPTKFNVQDPGYFPFLWEVHLKHSDIFYNCSK